MLLTINEGVLSARGGRATEANYQLTVHVPGIENYFRISDLAANVVPNDKHEYEKIINIESTATMHQQELAKKMHLYLLPKDKPAVGDVGVIKDYSWSSELEITKEVLAVSKKLDLNWIPSEREFMSLQSFKYSADEYRSIFLEIDKGLTSFGGYALAKPFKKLLQVPELPKSVKILHDGSLLSVSGSKKLSILSLNLQDVKYEVYRLLPNTINHLVTQTSGIFQKPDLLNSYSFDYENLAEVFSKIEHVANDYTCKNNYSVFDFSEYLNQAGLPKGLFLLKVMGLEKVQNSPLYEVED